MRYSALMLLVCTSIQATPIPSEDPEFAVRKLYGAYAYVRVKSWAEGGGYEVGVRSTLWRVKYGSGLTLYQAIENARENGYPLATIPAPKEDNGAEADFDVPDNL